MGNMRANTLARIEGARNKIEALNKKMERILAAKATDWKKNPYSYSEDDVRRTEKEIKMAENRLAYWESKGQEEDAKEAARNVKPILEFLNTWKAKVTQQYTQMFESYYKEYEEVKAYGKKMREMTYGTSERETIREKYETKRLLFTSKCHGYYEKQMVPSSFPWDKGKPRETQVKIRNGEYEVIFPYVSGNEMKGALEKLEEELTADCNAKYDNIVDRASYYCGKIEDASGLRVSPKGELDGIVTGNKGKCKITTIGAGGYNIQCFHFRVLVHEIKEIVEPVKVQEQTKAQKSDKKVDWKIYSEDDLIKMCGNLGMNIDHLVSIEDTRIKRMRLVMAIKKFGMVGNEIAPAAFRG